MIFEYEINNSNRSRREIFEDIEGIICEKIFKLGGNHFCGSWKAAVIHNNPLDNLETVESSEVADKIGTQCQ